MKIAVATGRAPAPQAEARHLRRARRRSRLGGVLPPDRAGLRVLLALPAADRPPGGGPGRAFEASDLRGCARGSGVRAAAGRSLLATAPMIAIWLRPCARGLRSPCWRRPRAAASVRAGSNPPLDRIFLPGGLAVDPEGRWLYVVNSNSDLRYNAGTVVAVDLDKAAADRRRTDWPDCPAPGYVPRRGPRATGFCCRDYFDPTVLNCEESGYIDPAATVQLGSFGGCMVVEHRPGHARRRPPAVRRRAGRAVGDLHRRDRQRRGRSACAARDDDEAAQPPVRRYRTRCWARPTRPWAPRLPEEPQHLVLDRELRLLYVAHGIRGAVAGRHLPGQAVLASTRRPVFERPGHVGHLAGCWSNRATRPPMSSPPGGTCSTRSRPAILTLRLRDAQQPCSNGPRRVEPGARPDLLPSAFYSNGTRHPRASRCGRERQRAYVLHRNGGNAGSTRRRWWPGPLARCAGAAG